ncbi:MAG: hypothetical protein IJC80_03535 [Clostridia bacterium]|nr:hypothetical protein [Clostridia bacterium]MBQ4108455.1 hypothetical protein [Clostridia bacterium]
MIHFYNVLTVLYLAIIVIVAVFIVVNLFKSKKVTDKIIGALALGMFLLRIFFIK